MISKILSLLTWLNIYRIRLFARYWKVAITKVDRNEPYYGGYWHGAGKFDQWPSPENTVLCKDCELGPYSTEGWQAILDGSGYQYRTTWEASDKAGKDCCRWCRFIAKEIAATRLVASSDAWEIRVAYKDESSFTLVGEKTLNVVMRLAQDGKLIRSYYNMYTNQEDSAAKFVEAAPARKIYRAKGMPNNAYNKDESRFDSYDFPSRDQKYEIVAKCIENCMRNHPMCREDNPDSFFPNRVIDCSDTCSPKLVSADDSMKHDPYTALSYVWGEREQLRTTTENIDKHATEGFDITQLSRTAMDAITVTCDLGMRYLWVDALCIIQDSEEDKAAQLGAMGRIYRNTYLTINAACSRSADEKFIYEHRRMDCPVAQIPYRCPDGTIGAVYIGFLASYSTSTDEGKSLSPQGDWDIISPSTEWDWDRYEPGYKISSRAWCFQERVLPPRSLIFGFEKLKFSCRTATTDVTGPVRLPHRGLGLPSSIWFQSSSKLCASDKEENRRAWQQAVTMYCRRNLSLASDKLPALSGVAELFHPNPGGKYLAGLWTETLLLDLLWKRTGDPRPRPKKYRAPSWSWAAIDGEVEAYYINPTVISFTTERFILRLAAILEESVKLESEHSPFGGVKDGTLKLEAGLKPAKLEKGYAAKNIRVLDKRPDERKIIIGSLILDTAERLLEGDVYVVPLIFDELGSFHESIVVVKVDAGRFRRIGRMSKYDTSDVEWLCNLPTQEVVIV